MMSQHDSKAEIALAHGISEEDLERLQAERNLEYIMRVMDWAMCPSYVPHPNGGVAFTEYNRPICRNCGKVLSKSGVADCNLRIVNIQGRDRQRKVDELTGKGKWVKPN